MRARKLVSILCYSLMFFWAVSGAATEKPFLYALQGVLTQVTDYTYIVTLQPEGKGLQARVPLVREADQPWYRVTIETQDLHADEPWADKWEVTDRFGNRWVTVSWRNPPDEVNLERRVRARSEALYGPIISSDPYPIEKGSLPGEVYEWLLPSQVIQSNDPAIKGLAQGLVSNVRTELEAVVRILSWIRDHVRYACAKELCTPVLRVDALATLEKGIGNCVCYANLATALLRAAGIPAMPAFGFVADRKESHAGHTWIAVYFPRWGWVESESADWMPASHLVPLTFLMPEHITSYLGEGRGISRAEFSELHQVNYDVVAQPEQVRSLSASVVAGESVSWFVAVACPDWKARTIELSLEGVPTGWYASLSQSSVRIDPDNDPWYALDVLLTVIPPEDVSPEERVEITISGRSEGQLLGRITAEVRVGE